MHGESARMRMPAHTAVMSTIDILRATRAWEAYKAAVAQKPMRVTRARVTSVSLMKSVASLSAANKFTFEPRGM